MTSADRRSGIRSYLQERPILQRVSPIPKQDPKAPRLRLFEMFFQHRDAGPKAGE
jgi:hypothetical protein